MQYILNEEEYQALTAGKKELSRKAEQDLLSLCRRAAAHIPVKPRLEGADIDPEPRGCILNEVGKNPGYCDKCPSKDACPYPHKQWSK